MNVGLGGQPYPLGGRFFFPGRCRRLYESRAPRADLLSSGKNFSRRRCGGSSPPFRSSLPFWRHHLVVVRGVSPPRCCGGVISPLIGARPPVHHLLASVRGEFRRARPRRRQNLAPLWLSCLAGGTPPSGGDFLSAVPPVEFSPLSLAPNVPDALSSPQCGESFERALAAAKIRACCRNR